MSSFETIAALPPPMREGILRKLAAARRIGDSPDPDAAALAMIDAAGEPPAPAPDEGQITAHLGQFNFNRQPS